MKVADISKQIIEGIAPVFIEEGFKVNKRAREFVREYNGCTQIFDLLFYKKGDTIEIEPIIRIKIKHIEDIYHHISIDHNDIFSTLGNNLYKVVKHYDDNIDIDFDGKSKMLVEDDKDVKKLIEVIPIYFKREGLRYFNENSSVARADELLNKYPREISIHNWLYPMRACLAIIAAKLNDNPKYNELVKIYEEELEDALDSYKQDFANLKKFLSEELTSHP
ncbi:hypothetical protein LS482_09745 [Sinomicrobium kalidii]|uniref:hypothetical protein n=1 Tax=Sinomicrobium kalidii TaxID=2900738 RepID=UPI001E2B650E|nr:hypothetical protein [Sinomicrobium kalidii]UGU18150.1 hypothetical protein LS482_09745 [Sinomicrobium kalidii]